MKKQRIAIFASGGGSNAMNILAHFEKHPSIEVGLLVTNNKNAGILAKSEQLVKQEIITNEEATQGDFLSDLMQKNQIDYIVLAGYLRKIPEVLIQDFPQHIINIHPALLPKYGGKGMYGMNVHKAVHANRETHSGITIHLVDEKYDNGKILYQHQIELSPTDSPEEIQQKVLKIEHQYFSITIEKYVMSKKGEF